MGCGGSSNNFEFSIYIVHLEPTDNPGICVIKQSYKEIFTMLEKTTVIQYMINSNNEEFTKLFKTTSLLKKAIYYMVFDNGKTCPVEYIDAYSFIPKDEYSFYRKGNSPILLTKVFVIETHNFKDLKLTVESVNKQIEKVSDIREMEIYSLDSNLLAPKKQISTILENSEEEYEDSSDSENTIIDPEPINLDSEVEENENSNILVNFVVKNTLNKEKLKELEKIIDKEKKEKANLISISISYMKNLDNEEILHNIKEMFTKLSPDEFVSYKESKYHSKSKRSSKLMIHRVPTNQRNKDFHNSSKKDLSNSKSNISDIDINKSFKDNRESDLSNNKNDINNLDKFEYKPKFLTEFSFTDNYIKDESFIKVWYLLYEFFKSKITPKSKYLNTKEREERHHRVLRKLDLSMNSLSDDILKSLMRSLLKVRLHSLNLSNNLITKEGCSYLAYWLERNKSLKELFLQKNSKNNFGSEGLNKVCSGILKHRKLELLNLSSISLTNSGDLLYEIITYSKIKVLILRDCSLNVSDFVMIVKAIICENDPFSNKSGNLKNSKIKEKISQIDLSRIQIHELDISENNDKESECLEKIKELKKLFTCYNKLSILRLEKFKLNNELITELLKNLKRLKNY